MSYKPSHKGVMSGIPEQVRARRIAVCADSAPFALMATSSCLGEGTAPPSHAHRYGMDDNCTMRAIFFDADGVLYLHGSLFLINGLQYR